jgi:hypothetical protein
VKQEGHEADQSPPSSVEINNGGAIPPIPIRLHGTVRTFVLVNNTLLVVAM